MTAPVFDRKKALAAVDGDRELLREMIALYLEDQPRMVRELRTAVNARDARRVAATAHALKGSVVIFGADEAVALASALEQKGRDEDLDGSDAILASFETQLARLEAGLVELARS